MTLMGLKALVCSLLIVRWSISHRTQLKAHLGFHPYTYLGVPIYTDYLNADSDGKINENDVFYPTDFMWQLTTDPQSYTSSSDD